MTFEDYRQIWLQNMVQAQQGLENAVASFSLACDKEVATKSAYKALGLDPRDAPTFGWGLMERQGMNMSSVVNMPGGPGTNGVQAPVAPPTAAPAPSGPPWPTSPQPAQEAPPRPAAGPGEGKSIGMLPAAVLAIASFLGGGGLGYGLAQVGRPAAATTPPAVVQPGEPPAVQPKELRLQWWIENGKVKWKQDKSK